MKKLIISILLILTSIIPKLIAKDTNQKDLVAIFHSNQGDFKAKLYYKKAPSTVSNFVTLVKSGFFNGILFEKVVPDLLIQSKTPEDKELPYTLDDEFHPKLTHNKPGILSMTSNGPNTSSSQFMITLKKIPSFNNKQLIFGEIIEGMEIVKKISLTQTNGVMPKEQIVITSISIAGSWYQPIEFKKNPKATKKHIDQISRKKIKGLIKNIGKSLGYSKLDTMNLSHYQSRGHLIQATYKGKFKDNRIFKLIFRANILENKKIEIAAFQFNTKKPKQENRKPNRKQPQ